MQETAEQQRQAVLGQCTAFFCTTCDRSSLRHRYVGTWACSLFMFGVITRLTVHSLLFLCQSYIAAKAVHGSACSFYVGGAGPMRRAWKHHENALSMYCKALLHDVVSLHNGRGLTLVNGQGMQKHAVVLYLHRALPVSRYMLLLGTVSQRQPSLNC